MRRVRVATALFFLTVGVPDVSAAVLAGMSPGAMATSDSIFAVFNYAFAAWAFGSAVVCVVSWCGAVGRGGVGANGGRGGMYWHEMECGRVRWRGGGDVKSGRH